MSEGECYYRFGSDRAARHKAESIDTATFHEGKRGEGHVSLRIIISCEAGKRLTLWLDSEAMQYLIRRIMDGTPIGMFRDDNEVTRLAKTINEIYEGERSDP